MIYITLHNFSGFFVRLRWTPDLSGQETQPNRDSLLFYSSGDETYMATTHCSFFNSPSFDMFFIYKSAIKNKA